MPEEFRTTRRAFVGALAATTALVSSPFVRTAAANETFKIGILTDLTGSFSDLGGPGTGVAAEIAMQEIGGQVLGRKVELLIADHQHKANVGLALAREWIERRDLKAFVDVMNSGIAIGVNKLVGDYKRLAFYSAAATDKISEDACNEYGIHWNTDTYAQTNAVAASMIGQGLDSWFFIVADYEFGHAMQASMDQAVKKAGGKVVGAVRHPLQTLDFSSYVLQAQASGAKVIAIASGGNDTVNTIKQAQEFGVTRRGQKVVALLPYLSDIHAVGLKTMQGLRFIDAWYWGMDDKSKEFADRFYARFKKRPTAVQASVYSSTLQYLKAVEKLGTDDPGKIRQYFLNTTLNDAFLRNGRLLPNGRMTHDVYLVEVKTPEESKGEWDYEKVIATVPADKAFRPLSESACKLRA
ncbi:ABC transporter substrate-binding protein [Undibacter mobilis]|uniref:ABC transporter permease n=1 Tax=Undibacter mobilis TaxID=2292256 RepID=A0A371BAT5_9BRAD|nr:ABC transporter substrate-binding protein [Undibacter mobilis]RDV04680.1 ABC transporter permease [Undibacter mobilis]